MIWESSYISRRSREGSGLGNARECPACSKHDVICDFRRGEKKVLNLSEELGRMGFREEELELRDF